MVNGFAFIDPRIVTTVLVFDTFGNPTRIADEARRVTRYKYGVFNRLEEVIQPDPDGTGTEWHPETQFVYTGTGRIAKEIRTSIQDPDAALPVYGDEIVTFYEYDVRHRLQNVYENFDAYQVDADHPLTQFEYDKAGNLTDVYVAALTDQSRHTQYEYDQLDRPIRIQEEDPDGATGSASAPVSYLAYDPLGRLTAAVDPRGSISRYEYDEHHRLRRVRAALGATTQYAYDEAGQLTSLTDAEGRTTGYSYDEAGRLTALALPGQAATPITYQYDTIGNTRFVSDQLGRTTEYQYDNLLRLTKEISPHPTDPNATEELGRPVTQFTYWDDGQLKTVTEKLTDTATRTTSYAYDDTGRLETVTLPQVWDFDIASYVTPEWDYLYDEFGRTTQVTDPRGYDTQYDYDDLYRVNKVIEPHPTNPSATGEAGRPVTSYAYDAANQLVSMTEKLAEGSSRTTHYDYDQLGRLMRMVEPSPTTGDEWTSTSDPVSTDGNPFTRYQYDGAGNLTATLVPDVYASGWTFATTSYAYDALNRRTSETDANGDTVRYAYDRVGNMVSLTDPATATNPAGNTTTWQYDPLDRVTKETNALGHARSFVYDAVGNLTQGTDRNGRVTRYAYDRLDRNTTESWYADAQVTSADRVLSFSYDLADRLLSSSDPDHDYDYTYDALDRVTFQSQSITGLAPTAGFLSVFDAAGHRRLALSVIGSTLDFQNNYAYDGLGRLTSLTQQDYTGGYAVADKRVDFGYDLAGQLDTVKRYTSIADTGGPVALTDFTFDQAGRLDKIEHRAGATPGSGTLLAGYGYSWNQRHELKTLDFLPNGANSPFNYSAEDVTYGYDDRGQLTGANYTGQTDESYQYDANGNRETVTNTAGTNQDYDTAGDNRLVDDNTFTYTYDSEGNRLTRTRISSAQADDKVTECAWDHRNRLIKVTFKNNAGTVTKTVDHAYDAQNQWIKRLVDPDGATGSAAVEQTVFLHENGQIVLQFDKTGTGNLAAADLSHRYLWGPAVDQLLADEVVASLTNATLNELLFALPDHLGTVRDIVDAAGTVRKHTAFDSYGRITDEDYYDSTGDPITASHAEAVEQLFGFTGHARDEATGLVQARRRWIDPDTGQWLSEDIVWDGYNRRIYVGNEPTIYSDPTGLWGLATGHHYFPLAEQSHLASRLTDAARRLAEGYFTGPTNPSHGYGPQGGVKHCDYNSAVRKEFNKYLKEIGKDKTGKVNAQEMRTFIETRLKNGKGIIGRFNRAVERIVKPSPSWVDPTKMSQNQLIQQGRKFRSDRGGFMSARLMGALAIAGGLALRQAEGFLDTCAETPYLRRAYGAAAEGDLQGTSKALLGSRAKNDAYGLYDELIARGLPLAALDFERAMTAIFEDIRADRDARIGDADE